VSEPDVLDRKQARGATRASLPLPSHARAVRVAADASMDELLVAVMSECTRHILANCDAARRGRSGGGVHQLRVGARRMRAALGLFGSQLPPEPTAALREELRWAAGCLSSARDWDVFLHQTLEPLLATDPADPSLRRLLAAAQAARGEAYRESRKALESTRFDELAGELGAWAAGAVWRDAPAAAGLAGPAQQQVCALLERRDRKVRELPGPIEALTGDELHRLRIRVKKLRYAGEFLAPLFRPKRARRHAKRLAAVQDALGRINDARVAEGLVAALLENLGGEAGPEVERAAGTLIGWLRRSEHDDRHDLAKRWHRYREARPYWRPREPR
jgi:CHAD domain-containing protein